MPDLSRLGRAYRREVAWLLDTYQNARAQGQPYSTARIAVANEADDKR